MALQAVAKPPADAHTNPPIKAFEHSQCARCAEVAEICRVGSLHDLRAHDQQHVNAIRFMAQQTTQGDAGPEVVAGSVRGRAGRCRRRWCVAGFCQQAPGSPKRRGAGAKGNTTKSRLVGLAAGQERCTAWRHGTQARPIVPSPNQRANSARQNPRVVTRPQRRGHPSRPLWRTGRQGRVKVLQ